MIHTIKRVVDKVRYILKHSKQSRDNDVFLYLTFLDRFHGLSDEIGTANCKKLYKLMKNSPFPESIRRSRQKIQEGGEYLGKKRLKRLKDSEEFRKEIHNV